ncbi:MAG: transglycosylase domain-containing protein [Candidatus Riflebacteria bacterium]|nr:transglycosylase domain-containing protein [Candidatus Riflebacteria bacterium]
MFKNRFVRIILVLLCVGALFLLAMVLFYANDVRLARQDTPKLFQSALEKYGSTIKPKDLPDAFRNALLAVEDPAFYQHHGVDLHTPGAGMTTITQGLVKLLYFPNGFQPGIEKIRQTLIAQYAFDSCISKDDQFLLFLNACYLGHENGQAIHGYENGSRVYFSKKFSEITYDDFLSLVAMHISPNSLKPVMKSNAERVVRIKEYLSGQRKPSGVLDVDYNGKKSGTFFEEMLMTLLRTVTNSEPE